MFDNVRNRRIARHGSNIVTEEERSAIGSSSRNFTMYQTAVVVDFVSNPVNFLSEKIDIVETEHEVAGNVANSVRDKIKERIQKINKFKKNNEELPVEQGESQKVRNVTRLEAYTNPKSDKFVENPEIISVMPRNSILGLNITDLSKLDRGKPEVFLPFFPAHFSLPVKPGEHVWIFYENIGGKRYGYWMFRKTATLPVDDVNYTHADKNSTVTPAKNILAKKNIDGITKKNAIENLFKAFPNSLATFDTDSGTLEDPDGYEKIIKESKSYNEDFIGEAVPRYNKKCSDLVLQGSNNTLIVMGHQGETQTGCIKLIAGRTVNQSQVVKNIRKNEKQYEHEQMSAYVDIFDDTMFLAGIPQTINDVDEFSQTVNSAEVIISQEGSISLDSDNTISNNSSTISSACTDFNVSSSRTSMSSTDTSITASSRIDMSGNVIAMNGADEPYVIHSALEKVLDKLISDVATLNKIMLEISLTATTAAATADPTGVAAQIAFGAIAASTMTVPMIIDNASTAPEMEKLYSRSIFGSR